MIKSVVQKLKPAFLLVVCMTIMTGIIYPLLDLALAQLFFPWQANGSLIQKQGLTIGSVLIGQSFADPSYFIGRPSATQPFPYNGAASGASNMGPANPNFIALVKARAEQLTINNPGNAAIPVDLVTASGSGLDPDITPLAAFYQIPRISQLTHIPQHRLEELVKQNIKKRTLGFLGEEHVNVLLLNLALEELKTVTNPS